MSTLFIRLPCTAPGVSPADRLALACTFALAHGKNITRQGTASLSDLSGPISTAQRVVLILAASDVTLLNIKTPPLSPARLKAALPNLAEEKLLGDPADCTMVAGDAHNGLRTIAVMQRAWLELLVRTLTAFGARQIRALPAQLCLPLQPDSMIAAIGVHHDGIELTIRLSDQEGIGLSLSTDPGETVNALCAVVPAAQIALHVPQASVQIFQDAISRDESASKRIYVFPDNWSHWITGAESASLDMMSGVSARGSAGLDWRVWRWPLTLAATILLINIAALNIDWWHMKREAEILRSTMFQTYKSAYPGESVIIDPIAQMQQKITLAKRNAGQATLDDFTAIMAAFGEAWSASVIVPVTGKANIPAIAAIEYRDRSLLVKFKPGPDAPMQQIKTALALRGLSLEVAPSPSATVAWKIGSAR